MSSMLEQIPQSSDHASLMAYYLANKNWPSEQVILNDLADKFLSILGLDLPSEKEPQRYHLHRDISIGCPRWGPMSGNDFNYPVPRITADPLTWSAVLRLIAKDTQTGVQNALEFPLAHTAQMSDGTLARMISEQALPLLRGLWPSTPMTTPKRRLLGPRFESPELPAYRIMAALSCSDMNAESVSLQVFERKRESGYYKSSRTSHTLLPRETDDSPIESFLQSPLSTEIDQSPKHVAHLWSFATVEDEWIISIPLVATLLSLMTNPNKSDENLERITPEDRDISWCLDAVQGFSRLTGPSEGDRDLSFSLGTYSDAWMYLYYILPGFIFLAEESPVDLATDAHHEYSGLRCDRLKFAIPSVGSFQEFRQVTFARVSVTNEEVEPIRGSPNFVGFVLTDEGHRHINATTSDWEERGIKSNEKLCGVSLFVNVLWDHLNAWRFRWDECLDQVTRSIGIKVEDLAMESHFKAKVKSKSPSPRAKLLFTVTHLLGLFQRHIAVVPRTVRQMTENWIRTYRGLHSDNVGRLSREDQAIARENWELILARVEKLQKELLVRIRDIRAEVKSYQDALLCVQTC